MMRSTTKPVDGKAPMGKKAKKRLLARWLAPYSRLEKVLLIAFVAWMSAGLVIIPLDMTPEIVRTWSTPAWLNEFMAACLRWGDMISLFLVAINTHLMLSRHWGVSQARRFALGAMLLGGALEAFGTLTGYPFGQYYYTDNFGPKLGGVLPVTIPISWYVVAANLLMLTRLLFPYVSTTVESSIVATLATAYDWVMEPFAVDVKRYWYWTAAPGSDVEISHIPWQNYLTWWVAMFVIIRLFAPTHDLKDNREIRPYVLIGGMLLIFVVGRIAYGY